MYMKINSSLCVAIVLAGATSYLHAESAVAKVVSVSGKAIAIDNTGKSKAVTVGTPLHEGDSLLTTTGTVGVNLLPGAITVELPNSQIKVVKLDYSSANGSKSRDIILELVQGNLSSAMVKHDGNSHFAIKTKGGTVDVVGTAFKVSCGKAGDLTVSTGSGTVSVTLPDGRKFTVKAGSRDSFKNGLAVIESLSADSLAAIFSDIDANDPQLGSVLAAELVAAQNGPTTGTGSTTGGGADDGGFGGTGGTTPSNNPASITTANANSNNTSSNSTVSPVQ